jgi:hypothetical protein
MEGVSPPRDRTELQRHPWHRVAGALIHADRRSQGVGLAVCVVSVFA